MQLEANDLDHARIGAHLASLTDAIERCSALIGEPPDPSTGAAGSGLRGHWVTREEHDAAARKVAIALIGLASTAIATAGGVVAALLG